MNTRIFYLFLSVLDQPIETAADRLINTQMENQRLQNELDSMERRFKKLDSRRIHRSLIDFPSFLIRY